MRRLLLMLMMVLVGGALFLPGGCGGKGDDDETVVIGLAVPSLSHPFFIYLQKNVMGEAEKLGVRIIAGDAGDSAARQMSIIEDFIVREVDGVLMSPVGADALVPAVESLNDANIPVATVDRTVNGGDVLIHVGADNVEGGRVAARYIIDKLGGKGKVIQLEGTAGASPAIDRRKGFEEAIAKSDIEIIVTQNGDFKRARGQAVMENLLQGHDDFQAVYAANDEMILGAIEAMDAHGADASKVITIGYDAIPDALDYIKQGKLNATVEQYPGRQARQALRMLVGSINDGKSPESAQVYLEPVAIDADNIDEAELKTP